MPWSDLYHYWQSKHVDGRPPSRGGIDPVVDVPQLLANIMLIGVEGTAYRNRLIGSSITRRVGRDSTGKPIDQEIFGPRTLLIWRGLMDAVSVDQQPQLVIACLAPSDKPYMLTIMLPLVGGDGRTEIILSGCFFDNILAAPRRPVPLEPIEIALPFGEANG